MRGTEGKGGALGTRHEEGGEKKCGDGKTFEQYKFFTKRTMVFARHDLWRRAPIFRYTFTDALPGFREGVALFAVVWAGEWAYGKFGGGEDHGHGHGHAPAVAAAAAADAHGNAHGATAKAHH